jgi:hypothetical protein
MYLKHVSTGPLTQLIISTPVEELGSSKEKTLLPSFWDRKLNPDPYCRHYYRDSWVASNRPIKKT